MEDRQCLCLGSLLDDHACWVLDNFSLHPTLRGLELPKLDGSSWWELDNHAFSSLWVLGECLSWKLDDYSCQEVKDGPCKCLCDCPYEWQCDNLHKKLEDFLGCNIIIGCLLNDFSRHPILWELERWELDDNSWWELEDYAFLGVWVLDYCLSWRLEGCSCREVEDDPPEW